MRTIWVAALAGLILGFAAPVDAGIDDSFDWVDDPATSKPKRKLKVFYNFGAADKLGDKTMTDIMDEALKNWNDVKADTGWEFVSGGTAGDHDVEIKVADIDRNAGGASTTGFPAAGAKTRTVSKLTITFDPTPKEGFEWGAGDDSKKNAVSNAKHELTHVMRLDHQGGIRSKSGKLKDPQGKDLKGDDVLTPSADDKNEAKTSSTAPIKVATGPAGGGTGFFASVPGFAFETPNQGGRDITLSIDPFVLQTPVEVAFSRTSLYSMPLPFSVPTGIDRMIKGVHIDLSNESGIIELGTGFIELTIPYEDGEGGEGFLVDLADGEYTPLLESSLGLFFYDPISQSWQPVPAFGYAVDPLGDLLTASLPASLLAELQLPEGTSSLFLSLGAAAVPEPGTLALMGLAVTALLLLRRRAR